MARFTAIPEIPLGGMTDWMFAVLSAMKENIELLTGTRGEADKESLAVTRSSITATIPQPTMIRVTATGEGYTIEGAQVASLNDHIALINDVQLLANDVAALRATLEQLVYNMKG